MSKIKASKYKINFDNNGNNEVDNDNKVDKKKNY